MSSSAAGRGSVVGSIGGGSNIHKNAARITTVVAWNHGVSIDGEWGCEKKIKSKYCEKVYIGE